MNQKAVLDAMDNTTSDFTNMAAILGAQAESDMAMGGFAMNPVWIGTFASVEDIAGPAIDRPTRRAMEWGVDGY